MNKSKFSIIIPTLNASKTLEKALDSIVTQSYKSYQIIIVDGDSADCTCEIVKQYQQKCSEISLIIDKDKGIYDAMNKGIALSTSEWLYFMGADDELFDENVLKDIIESGILEQNKVVYGNVKIRGNNEWAHDGDIYDGQFDLKKLLKKNICQQAIFYPRNVFDEFGLFDLRYSVTSDWNFNLKCFSNRDFIYLDRIIARFATGGKSSFEDENINFKEFLEDIFKYYKIDLGDKCNCENDSPFKETISIYNEMRYNLNPENRSISQGISLFTALKNRSDIFEEALKTWIIHKEIDEIVIVDWSSDNSQKPIIDKYQNGKIFLAEVKNQNEWVLSKAFNLAARLTSRNKILKIDSDVKIFPDFFEKNKLEKDCFLTGSWEKSRNENETHLNGALFIDRKDFFDVNGYNESLSTYGWDDTDLYSRIEKNGLTRNFIDLDSLYHIEHGGRMLNQIKSIDFTNISDEEWARLNILKNRHIAYSLKEWDSSFPMAEFSVDIMGSKVWSISILDSILTKVSPDIENEGLLNGVFERLKELSIISQETEGNDFSKEELFFLYNLYLNNESDKDSFYAILFNKIHNSVVEVRNRLKLTEKENRILINFLETKDNIIIEQGQVVSDLQYENDQKEKMLEKTSDFLKESLNEIMTLKDKIGEIESSKDSIINELQIEKEDKSRRLFALNSELNGIRKSITFKLIKTISRFVSIVIPSSFIEKLKSLYILNKQYRVIKKSKLFDVAYYLNTNVDVAKSKHNPIKHYLLYGSSEGRNPSRSFDNDFYLRRYPDVKENGMNPLLHYFLYGRNEGRIATNYLVTDNFIEEKKTDNILADENKDVPVNKSEDEVRLIKESGMFDNDFYLKQYPDVFNSGIDPVYHFHNFGWKENRKPNPEFNTSYYLLSNPDIVSANIDPFYHYIVAGKAEERAISHPCEIKVERMKQAYAEKVNNSEISVNSLKSDDLSKLYEQIKRIKKSKTKRLVVSLSHDDYIENIGGIQLCIIEEQKAFSENGYVYIHLSPDNINKNVNDTSDYGALRVIIDGEKVGYFLGDQIINIFDNELNDYHKFLIIHSIINHNRKLLIKICDSIDFERKFFWIHDHSTICYGYTLLRNNVEYCNAPDINTNTCQLCVFSDDRIMLQKFINELFTNNTFEIVAPSDFALGYWKSKVDLPHKKSYVVGHVDFIGGGDYLQVVNDDIIKIAYIGIPAYHKGWYEFETLVKKYATDKRFYFMHIGMFPSNNPSIHFFESKLTVNNPDLMIDNIKKYQVDFCFIWPKLTETFSFVTFEAIAAGSEVITNNSSGNVKELVLKMGRGIVYESIDKLYDNIESGSFFEYIQNKKANNKYFPYFERSKMTYSLLTNDES